MPRKGDNGSRKWAEVQGAPFEGEVRGGSVAMRSEGKCVIRARF